MIFKKTLIATLLLLVLMSVSFANTPTVIVNNNVPDGSLSAKEIKDIYLGRKTTWSDGSAIQFVVLNNDPTKATFMKDFVGKSAGQFKNYWNQKVFTGQGTPPKSFDSDSELVNFVSTNSGAIGFISSSSAAGSSKVVSIN